MKLSLTVLPFKPPFSMVPKTRRLKVFAYSMLLLFHKVSKLLEVL
jgi:hypothetical protein